MSVPIPDQDFNFKVLSDCSPNMIFVNDFNGVIYANLKCTEVLGYSQDEFISPSFNFLGIVAPESIGVLREAFSGHQKGLDVDPCEYVLVSKNGARIHVVILTKLITWEGRPAILGTVTDITSYKQLEKQLRESEEKYTLLLDSSLDAVFVIKGTSFVYVNEGAVEMLGYDSKEELLSTSMAHIVAPEYRDMVLERANSRQAGESPISRYEVNLLRKDGSKVIVEFNISMTDFEGSAMNLTFARDISEAVKHRDRLTTLLGHAVKLASTKNMEDIIDSTQDALENALDFQYASYLERVNDTLVIRSRFQNSNGLVLPLNGNGLTVKAANTKRNVLVNDTRLEPSYLEGSLLSLSELDVPIILGENVVGVLNVEGKSPNMFTENDMQALKLLSIHVSTAIDRLNKQNEVTKLRDEQFKRLIDGYKRTSASVRHDLRSPLMSVINAVSILNIQPDNKQMKDLLLAKTKFIETVLEDWKHQSYNGRVNRIRVNIQNLFTAVLDSELVPAEVEVITIVDKDLQFMLDNNGIVRVVSNLVKNSVEAINGAGTLTLRGFHDENGLTIQVVDDGDGIKQELLPQVFTPFFTTKESGTGIGLSYVKETVEAHGGVVCIASLEGEGTTVSLQFPDL
jgi:PAS domain S-box-containing protein